MKKCSAAVTLTLLGTVALGSGCGREPPAPPVQDPADQAVAKEDEKREDKGGGGHGSTTTHRHVPIFIPTGGYRSPSGPTGGHSVTPRGGFGSTGHAVSGAS